jgi:Cep192 domain 4
MTRSRRYVRRLAAVATVGMAGAIAWASGGGDGPDVIAVPSVLVIEQQIPTGRSGTLQLKNVGMSPVTITNFVSSGCGAISAAPTGGFPLTIPANTMVPVMTICPSATTPGMPRCLFHAQDMGHADIVDFMVVCESYSADLLTAMPTSLAFPPTMIGTESSMPLQIINSGTIQLSAMSLQIDDLAGNFQLGMPCNPDGIFCSASTPGFGGGTAQLVTVKCKPTAVGSLTAKLYAVASDGLLSGHPPPSFQGYRLAMPVNLTCTGVANSDPIFNETPTTVDVPPVEVNGGTGTGVVHVSNVGSGTLQITDVRIADTTIPGAAADWSYAASGKCTGTIPPTCSLTNGQIVDLNIAFDPSQIGSRNAALQISYHDTSDRSTSVPLNSSGKGATLVYTGPNPIDFGTVPVNVASTPVPFMLSNGGNRDLAMVSIGVNPIGAITVNPTSIAALKPTMPVTVNATCKPTAVGAIPPTMIHIASTDAAFGSPIDVPVTCSGTNMALFAMPSTVNFGEIRTGTATQSFPITLNSTSGTLTLNNPTIPSDPSLALTALSGMTTPADFDVQVIPTIDETVATSITASDTNDDMVMIPVSGKIVTATIDVPSTLSLGTFCISAPTTSSAVALQSTGTATIKLPMAPALSMDSPFDLALSSPVTYPAMLPPGGLATVEVTPKRVSVPTTVSDNLVWSTDVMNAATPQTALSATFVANGGAIAPSALDFGSVPIHLPQDNAKRVTIQNCDTTVLHLNAPMIDAPFVISGPPPPDVLQPMETATFAVAFQPTMAGKFDSQLVITSDDLQMSLTVDLTGIGTSGMGGDDDGSGGLDHTSFYACSCNGPGAPARGWPIALAIAIVVFRRRRA